MLMPAGKFYLGCRVRLSPYAHTAGLYRGIPDRRGTVVGGSHLDWCVTVIWDGTVSRQCLSKDFLEPVFIPHLGSINGDSDELFRLQVNA